MGCTSIEACPTSPRNTRLLGVLAQFQSNSMHPAFVLAAGLVKSSESLRQVVATIGPTVFVEPQTS